MTGSATSWEGLTLRGGGERELRAVSRAAVLPKLRRKEDRAEHRTTSQKGRKRQQSPGGPKPKDTGACVSASDAIARPGGTRAGQARSHVVKH